MNGDNKKKKKNRHPSCEKKIIEIQEKIRIEIND